MKILCDVCNKAEAAVFCTADEASLCVACDHRVHHANKLASKHHRFSLLHPSSNQFPVCDICHEKRAFLFCQQDRAILCKECDHPIHSANEHTQKHNRFLLTGVKLSPTSELYESANNSGTVVTDPKTKSVSVSLSAVSKAGSDNPSTNSNQGGVTSSISEYLTEILPSWHVEDLLDNPSSTAFGFSKTDNAMLPPFLDCELEHSSNNMNMGIWVPQAPSPLVYPSDMGGLLVGFKDTNSKAHNNINNGSSRRRSDDSSFTVPQISFSSVGSKRSRDFW